MKKIIFTLLILGMHYLTIGQELKTYTGVFDNGKVRGEATYTYYEDEDEQRIYEGKFQCKVYIGFNIHLQVRGTYKNNLKEGTWTYSINGVAYEEKVNDTLTINYKQGVMDGKYSHISTGLDPKNLQFAIKNNRIVGKVSQKLSDGMIIEGQFDEDGYPDGIWTSKKDVEIVTEVYRKGCLIDLKWKNESTGEVKKYKTNEHAIDPKIFWNAYDTTNGKALVEGRCYKLETDYETSYNGIIGDHLPAYFANLLYTDRMVLSDVKPNNFKGSERYEGVPLRKIRYEN